MTVVDKVARLVKAATETTLVTAMAARLATVPVHCRTTPMPVRPWAGTLRWREYALLLGSVGILARRLPGSFLAVLLATALVVYAIGESPGSRRRKLMAMLVTLGGFVYLKFQYLQPRPFLVAFFLLRCVDFGLSQRPETRGLDAGNRFGRFLLWMFFLPTMFVGPMVSYRDFYRSYTPRLATWGQVVLPNLTRMAWGGGKIALVVWGSGRLGLVDPTAPLSFQQLFVAPLPPADLGVLSQLPRWLLVWSTFGVDLLRFYLVFSGCCDIAIALARGLGFHLAENFDKPLLSRSPVRYWQTSNISVYRWLMTHVFFPYWGHTQVAAKIMTTFLVSALWHLAFMPTASWEATLQIGLAFTVFGLVATAISRFPRPAWGGWLEGRAPRFWRRVVWLGQVALTFAFVALINRLFWNGFTGKSLAVTMEEYRQLVFGL